MNPNTDSPRPSAPAQRVCASARLEHNRVRLAMWLEHERAAQARPSVGSWAARSVWPLISDLRQNPTAVLALGALVSAWQRPSHATGNAPAPVSRFLVPALTAARRHPKTTLALVALAAGVWWWSRSPPHPPSSP